jgi:hypothetical protein
MCRRSHELKPQEFGSEAVFGANRWRDSQMEQRSFGTRSPVTGCRVCARVPAVRPNHKESQKSPFVLMKVYGKYGGPAAKLRLVMALYQMPRRRAAITRTGCCPPRHAHPT